MVVRGAALEVAERIGQRYCDAVRDIKAIESGPRGVTISVGIAGVQSPGAAPASALLARADDALYQAKNAGRDRVVVDMQPVESPSQAAGLRDRGRP